MATEIRVRCAQAKKMLSKPNRKIKEIKSLIQKRYNFNDETNKLELSIKPLAYDPACCAAANCENLKFKLLAGTPVRNAANNVMGTVMRQGKAIGCEVIICGKVRGQRAKAQKYTMGYQVSTGQPKNDFIDKAIRHVELRQGMIGIKVKIMQATEIGTGINRKVMPDTIKIHEPKDENEADLQRDRNRHQPQGHARYHQDPRAQGRERGRPSAQGPLPGQGPGRGRHRRGTPRMSILSSAFAMRLEQVKITRTCLSSRCDSQYNTILGLLFSRVFHLHT